MQKESLTKSNIKILICCHKPCDLPQDDIFLPVQVGAALTDNHWGIQRDDQLNNEICDNISNKNKSYCELTAVYWAWKNLKKLYPYTEYIGINHYRRYFDFDYVNNPLDKNQKKEALINTYSINEKRLFNYLEKDSTIIAKKKVYPYSLRLDYCNCHISDDFLKMSEIVKKLYPEYSNSYAKIMEENNLLAHYNMCIMKYEDFDNYCNWLFSILFEVEKNIDISKYNDLQKRIFGYMSERLLNVWVFHNRKNVKELPVIFYSDIESKSSHYLRKERRRYNMAFYFTLPTFKLRLIKFITNKTWGRKLYSSLKK